MTELNTIQELEQWLMQQKYTFTAPAKYVPN